MKTLQKVIAISGILYFVITLIAVGMTASIGLTEQSLEMGDVGNVLTIMAENLNTVVGAMWLFNLANVLMIIFGIGLATYLDEDQILIRYAAVLITIASVCLLLETTMTIGIAQGLALDYIAVTGTEQSAISTTSLALIYFRNATALLAGLLLAVAGLLFGATLLRLQNQGWPRWMAWIVLISGVFGLLGGLYPFVDALSFVRTLSFALFSFWAMVVGIKFFRN